MRLLCTLAVRGAFERMVIPAFERAGHAVSVEWAPTKVLMDRVAAGERADVLVAVSEAMEGLAERGVLDAGSLVALARSGLGVAVKAGAPWPDVSSEAAFVRALRAARCVAYSRAGASGIYFAGLIERLGIATAVNAKAVVISAGFTAERLLTGEADLAVQQVSELKAVPGIEIAGRFPAGAQTFITLCAAAFTEAAEPDVARAFLGTLRSEGAVAAYAESGLEEVG